MRKTIMALILVIPMVFVLVVFSSVKLVALSVDISASSIRIYAENAEDGTLYVDMSAQREYTVTAQVMPENAKNRGYKLASADPTVVEVTEEGKLIPKKEGTAAITATSDDKGYTDSLSVVVAASGVYDLSLSLYNDNDTDLLTAAEGGYSAELETGRYRYSVSILPAEFKEYTLEAEDDDTVIIDEGERTILLPFSGEAAFSVSVPDSALKKDVHLTVTRPQGGILVNGVAGSNAVKLAQGAEHATLYIESDIKPTFDGGDYATATITQLGNIGSNRYRLDVTIADGFEGDNFSAQITAGTQTAEATFSFADFDFKINSDLATEDENGTPATAVVVGNTYRFYAVSTVAGADVEYEWTLEGGQQYLTASKNTASCTVKAEAAGDYRLRVAAKRDGKPIGDERELIIHAVENVGAVRITNNVKVDLAEAYTIAGHAYDGDLRAVEENYNLKVFTFTPGKPLVKAGGEIVYSVSDESIAKVETVNGDVYVVPLGEGQVTITAEWRWNKAFNKNLRTTLVLNVIKDAIFVASAPEYMKAMEEKRVTVLKNDISLGTDRSGAVLDDGTLNGMFKSMKSTYNIEWYKHTDLVQGGMNLHESDANVSYVSEITNDLYGNGFNIDADAFTHALDGNGMPRLNYRGPLYFVAYKQIASVAGQDNCAFLIRTDGVKLYGVNLLGCKDSSLLSNEGNYDLTQLNLVGTTLEVNADCDIINCRIRNGRNVVRTYGGNRDGEHYFVDSLSSESIAEGDRIHVNIEGCILSQGREFILKIGANRALRANVFNGAEPQLRNQSGQAYGVNGKSNWYDLLNDDYFYDHYVMTDVTLKDSVLETSGFFTVGIESNFAGTFLYNGTQTHQWREFTKSWEYSGGTSFASVLRLEGDVRLYDWKDISLVDSSTLIESPTGALQQWLKLDVAKMLEFVYNTDTTKYGNVLEEQNGKKFVHGGIAFYGGGRNYSQLDRSKLTGKCSEFEHYQININVLAGAEDASMQKQGELLPSAAGLNDFNFFMYSANGASNYSAQLADSASGGKYKGIKSVPAF